MELPALEVFATDPECCGIFLDFDGTLSEIVDHPAAARPLSGVPELLSRLSSRFGLVAVVSGRSTHQLVEWLGPDVEIWGLHGAERAVRGEVMVADAAAAHLPLMRGVLEELRSRDLREIEIEDKGVMIGLHYRRAANRAAAGAETERVAKSIANEHGLIVGHGRLVLELRPPVAFSKADVIARRARELELRGAVFAGDDIVDLPAFEALDELATQGVATIRIAVASEEAPQELLDRADVVVAGPAGVAEWLRSLLG